MGGRGPIPKRRRLGHISQAQRNARDVVVVRHCNRPGCDAVLGHVRYDPDNRWCQLGHAQNGGDEDGAAPTYKPRAE